MQKQLNCLPCEGRWCAHQKLRPVTLRATLDGSGRWLARTHLSPAKPGTAGAGSWKETDKTGRETGSETRTASAGNGVCHARTTYLSEHYRNWELGTWKWRKGPPCLLICRTMLMVPLSSLLLWQSGSAVPAVAVQVSVASRAGLCLRCSLGVSATPEL